MNDDNSEQHYAKDLVMRFEQMMAENASYYFDIDQFEEIIEYYNFSGKLKHALEVIEYGYSLFPENTTLLFKEAQILTGVGRLNKALQRLRMLEQIEQSDEVLLLMASIYSQQREHRKAISLLFRVLELTSEDSQDEIYMEIALEYENMERFDKAQEILQEAILKFPENEILLYELAYCFDLSERTAESVEYYQSFIEKYPYSFPAWYNLANAYQKLEMMDKALDAYDYSIAIQSDFTPAYYNKALSLFKMDRFQEAINVFEETYHYEPPQAPVYCHIGECFEKMDQFDKALFYYRKSIQTDEFYADGYLGVGVIMDLQDNTAEGLPFVERAVELEPDNVDYLLFKVEFLKKLEHWDEVEVLTQSLIKRFPDNEDVWLEYSDVFFKKDDAKSALDTLLTGLEHCPKSDEIHFRKVAYLMALGRITEAEELMFFLAQTKNNNLSEIEDYYPEIRNNLVFIELSNKLK